MDMESVSNELILEFLRDFKSDVNRRFSEIDKRFEQVETLRTGRQTFRTNHG